MKKLRMIILGSGIGIGLLAIISCAIGLLIAIVLPNKDSALMTSRIQAITVTEVGHSFIKRLTIRPQPPAAAFGGGSAACRVRRTPRNGDIHCALQAKFAASFVLPTPLYCATCG